MFTGIIKAIGQITHLNYSNSILSYAVLFPDHFLQDLERGASVSIDGICQTVVNIEHDTVWFEAIEETLKRTTLKNVKIGDAVNLERAAKFGDEIGGHLLSGHVYGTALVEQIHDSIYTLKCRPEWMKYLFPKGYVALNGASLTIVDVNLPEHMFTVHLIPETLKRTTFAEKKINGLINVEFDAQTQALVETCERSLQNFS